MKWNSTKLLFFSTIYTHIYTTGKLQLRLFPFIFHHEPYVCSLTTILWLNIAYDKKKIDTPDWKGLDFEWRLLANGLCQFCLSISKTINLNHIMEKQRKKGPCGYWITSAYEQSWWHPSNYIHVSYDYAYIPISNINDWKEKKLQ